MFEINIHYVCRLKTLCLQIKNTMFAICFDSLIQPERYTMCLFLNHHLLMLFIHASYIILD